jgi:hypothetical protein
MTTEEVQNRIRKLQQLAQDPIQKNYWKNIGFSYRVIENCITQFNIEKELIIAAGYAKLMIMELWMIKELLTGLGKSSSELDALIPDLKKFRDAYAHLKERVEGIERPNWKTQIPLNSDQESVANGILKKGEGHVRVTQHSNIRLLIKMVARV